MQHLKPHIILLIKVLAFIVAINVLGNIFYKRIDLTNDKRYTLSASSIQIINQVKSPLIIDLFLEGELTPNFKRLNQETRQLIEEFSITNKHIKLNVIDPLNQDNLNNNIQKKLSQYGIEPFRYSLKENGQLTQKLIYPWAIANYNGKSAKIPLIKYKFGASQQDIVTHSTQQLEYALVNGLKKVIVPKKYKIAILKGNGQLPDIYIADFLKSIRDNYFLAPFTLDSVAVNPQKTLDKLLDYHLIISAKPTEVFTENEKFVLDQYHMKGGKSLWLSESIIMDKDSLRNVNRRGVAVARQLNLNDFFFAYGVRINPVIVSDLYSAPITLAIGEGNNTQYQPLQWPYSPLATNNNKHEITNNLNLVKFDFASQIDTLKNSVKKTVLLHSSQHTKLESVPREINLSLVTKELDPSSYTKNYQNLAVLLEGSFKSMYANRIKPFETKDYLEDSRFTKMIVISDGDIIKNRVLKNKPQELGFDQWTKQTFGNKDFLLNAVNYLLDDYGLIKLRNKDVAIAFLDTNKIASQKTKWQVINIIIPLAFLLLFGIVFNILRKKLYA